MLDLVVRNAVIVDGTGAPGRGGDVGVRDGRIVAVGSVDEAATRTVDADGMVLAPGFIDLHTHYDAQVLWDRRLNPTPLHGVTTVIAGNCGYSLGPVAPRDRQWLLALLARVEGVPMAALDAGVKVEWETFGGYLDTVEGPLGANMGFYVGHSPLRRAVMGPAASTDRATPEQIEAMCRLLDISLAAGGVGFATAIQAAHVDGDSRPTPPQAAHFDEMRALATVCGRHPGTWIQMTASQVPLLEEQEQLFTDMSVSSGRPVTWLLVRELTDTAFAADAERVGANLWGQMFLIAGIPFRQSFLDNLLMRNLPHPWAQVMDLSAADRLAALHDPEIRRQLRDALEQDRPKDLRKEGADRWARFEVNDSPHASIAPLLGTSLSTIAAERGCDEFEAALDIACEAGLEVGFAAYGDAFGANHENQAALLRDPHVVIGASDAGAHIDSLVGADFGTRLFTELVRKHRLLSVEQAVHCLTGALATRFGLVDRGAIREGVWADLVLFDPERIEPTRMHGETNWPGDALHMTNESVGIDRVIVAGREVVVGGEYTGDLPGRVLRSGVDTATP